TAVPGDQGAEDLFGRLAGCRQRGQALGGADTNGRGQEGRRGRQQRSASHGVFPGDDEPRRDDGSGVQSGRYSRLAVAGLAEFATPGSQCTLATPTLSGCMTPRGSAEGKSPGTSRTSARPKGRSSGGTGHRAIGVL